MRCGGSGCSIGQPQHMLNNAKFFGTLRLDAYRNNAYKKTRVYCFKFLTLKQTQSENGSVTITKAQDMAVRAHPQRPTPLSDSSAEMRRKRIVIRNPGPINFAKSSI